MKLTKKDKRPDLVKEIDRLTGEMAAIVDPTDPEYKKLADQLKELVDMEVKLRPRREKKSVDPNTLITNGTGLIQMLLVLHAEEIAEKIIRSKAFGWIVRGRV